MTTTVGVSYFVLVVCFCVIAAKNVDSRFKRHDSGLGTCDEMFFQSRNITISSDQAQKGSICGGHCCDHDAESVLKDQGRKDFVTLLKHNTRSLLGPINRTSSIIQNHVWELTTQSENRTLILFSQVYNAMAELAVQPIEAFYTDIRNYVKIDPLDQKPTNTPTDIANSVDRFFTDLFPLAYHGQTGFSSGDFTPEFKQCLKDNMDVIAPFSDFPKQVSESLSKSLEATRLLLQALSTGIDVLNSTYTMIIDEHTTTNSECHEALLKMTYCPRCLALSKNSRPCSDYCLNVMRGCLNKYVAELDIPWNSYVEGIESLINALKRNSNEAGTNVDLAIKNLDVHISSAIMNTMSKIKEIDSRVKMSCKIPQYKQTTEVRTSDTSKDSVQLRQPNSRIFPHFPVAHVTLFLSTMAKTKGFYANLADNLCSEESFAEQRGKVCWNGERIAEYTKTVVDVGQMQKYNPEVKTSPDSQSLDPKIANLVDKLRHVHHMAVTSLGPNYSDPDYMQRDGVDGSGSGNGPDFEDDDEYSRGSGSGHGPIESDGDEETPRVFTNTGTAPGKPEQNEPTVTLSSAIARIPSLLVLLPSMFFICTGMRN
ncbi:division abnormally delayed protein [Rhynchophorus ferrugineus]|uniref:division abnormally delayed protein n=1 Tax=Rhynchophorus ferrugineus TaxID=354439 RepID=UPI003FCDD46E